MNHGAAPATRRPRDAREVLVFGLLGAFLVAAPVAWAGGQLAARLSSGSFLPVGLGEAGGSSSAC